MIFGKYINRYYLKHAPVLLLGLAALLTVDYIQLLIPQLYRLVINGVNLGQVVVNGETLPFTKEVLLQHICLPMIWIVAGADVRPQPQAVPAVLSGEQGRQPDEPVHQRPGHHSGVLW